VIKLGANAITHNTILIFLYYRVIQEVWDNKAVPVSKLLQFLVDTYFELKFSKI
jgi:hypothetical protein